MKGINNYISEKLKIDKDIKIFKEDKLLDLILSIIQYDTEDKYVSEEIKKWIINNDVKLISIYFNKDNSNSKEYQKSLDKDIKNKIEFVTLGEYVKEFNNIFPKTTDYNRYVKYSNSKFKMMAVEKGIEFERKEYEILIKKRATIDD